MCALVLVHGGIWSSLYINGGLVRSGRGLAEGKDSVADGGTRIVYTQNGVGS